MTVLQKTSVTLLISVLIFSAFTVLAFTGLFDLVESKFYNPSISKSITQSIKKDADLIDSYLSELKILFKNSIEEEAVKRSFLPHQSSEDIFERTRRFGLLLESVRGLQSVRFIDTEGRRIHFSTEEEDILRRSTTSLSYKNYGEQASDLPPEKVLVSENSDSRIIIDPASERLLFLYPFKDSFDVHRGTALFSYSVGGLTEYLIMENRLRVGEYVGLIESPKGIVSGLSRQYSDSVLSVIVENWENGILGPVSIGNGESGVHLVLFSALSENGFHIGRVQDEKLFTFPFSMKLLLLISFFLTTYLSVFLLFNIRQDSLTIISDRIKRLQLSLLEEYYDRKQDIDLKRWSRELEQRREEVRIELTRGLNKRIGKKHKQDIDSLVDRSWDELIALIGGKAAGTLTANIDEGQLQDLLGKVLAAGLPAATQAQPAQTAARHQELAEAEEVEELADAEEVEELAEAEEVEELAEAEEVEELAEAEEVEELADAEEVEELAEAEEVEELAEAEEVEEFAEAEEVEELAEAEEVEELPEAEEVEELAEVEEVEELAEAEEVEELAEAEEVEELDEAEELEELAEAEEVEELPEAEESTYTESKLEAELDTYESVRKNSNIRIIFDDDDIPVIVESSGIELADDEDDTDFTFIRTRQDVVADDITELEELEEDASLMEELDEFESEGTAPKEEDHESKMARIASEIEFSQEETSPIPDFDASLYEVSSPFDTLLSDLFTDDFVQVLEEVDDEVLTELDSVQPEESEETANLEELDTAADQDILFNPFQNSSLYEPDSLEALEDGVTEPELGELQSLDDEADHSPIKEKDGLIFIADDVYESEENPDTYYDPELGTLIKSVIQSEKR